MSKQCQRRLLVLLTALCVLVGSTARATTVIAPTFNELVEQAETIFVGEVVSKSSRFEDRRDGRVIMTDVTFRVVETWKGTAESERRLEFLGGTLVCQSSLPGTATSCSSTRRIVRSALSSPSCTDGSGSFVMRQQGRMSSETSTVRRFDRWRTLGRFGPGLCLALR
jgi:hypothetical protein